MAKTLYVCKNPACLLGTQGRPGRFTGGITRTQKHLLTGTPERDLVKDVDYGEGICFCGTKEYVEKWNPDVALKTELRHAKEHYDAKVAELKKEGVR